jgi:hypothetical protein
MSSLSWCQKLGNACNFSYFKNSLPQTFSLALISGFRRNVDEICGLLGYHASSCGNGFSTLTRNVGKQLPHDAA